MKFAKVLQQTLVEEDLPADWVEAAIKYKVLKKTIARVVRELEFLGLAHADLKLLLNNNERTVELTDAETEPGNPIVAEYTLQKAHDKIVPFLKITLNSDAAASAHSELAEQIRARLESVISDDEHIVEVKEEENQLVLLPTPLHTVNVENNEIVIVLKLDSKFFKMLQAELDKLEQIRQAEEQRLLAQIESVSNSVLLLRRRRSDLYLWRELFRVYLDSQIFFRYNETLQGLARDVALAKAQLDAFEQRVEKTAMLDKFGKRSGMAAYRDFLAINERLLKIVQFQTINTTALRKILKKFDKRTALNISSTFPKLISTNHIFVSGALVAQKICYVMQNSLLTLIPQLDDYTCPICISVAYKPIRLECGHLFCVRCLVKLKQRHKTECPFCRRPDAVLRADLANLDVQLQLMMEQFFPKEVKEKLRDADREQFTEVVGKHKPCVVT